MYSKWCKVYCDGLKFWSLKRGKNLIFYFLRLTFFLSLKAAKMKHRMTPVSKVSKRIFIGKVVPVFYLSASFYVHSRLFSHLRQFWQKYVSTHDIDQTVCLFWLGPFMVRVCREDLCLWLRFLFGPLGGPKEHWIILHSLNSTVTHSSQKQTLGQC